MEQLAHVVENRNGVIAVTRDAKVYGNGVYDGAFNVPKSAAQAIAFLKRLDAFIKRRLRDSTSLEIS